MAREPRTQTDGSREEMTLRDKFTARVKRGPLSRERARKEKEERVSQQAALRERVVKVMHEYGFLVHRRTKFRFEITVEKEEFGRLRRIVIYCGGSASEEARRAFAARDKRVEYWFVDEKVSGAAVRLINREPDADKLIVRTMDIGLLEMLSSFEGANSAPGRSGGTAVVRAVSMNKQEIILMAASLIQMLDTKIEELKGSKPNDPDRVAEYQKNLTDFEKLKAQVEELQKAVANFKPTPAKSKAIEKKAGLFRSGVEDWWKKNHVSAIDKTLDRALDVGVFATCVGICTLAGVPLPVAAITAAMVTRKKGVKGAAKAATGAS